MSRNTREYRQASSWCNRGGAPPAKQHTKNSHSGCSKRATRGYQSDCEDRSRQWEDHKASGPAKENEEVSEAVAVAEVDPEENREKKKKKKKKKWTSRSEQCNLHCARELRLGFSRGNGHGEKKL